MRLVSVLLDLLDLVSVLLDLGSVLLDLLTICYVQCHTRTCS